MASNVRNGAAGDHPAVLHQRFGTWLRGFCDRHFPDREVLFLGSGRVTSRRFSQRQQVVAAVVAAVAGLWLVGGTLDFVLRYQTTSKMGRELARLRATTDAATGRDAEDQDRLARLSAELELRNTQFRAAVKDTAVLGDDLAKLAHLIEQPDHADDLASRMAGAMAALSDAHGRQSALSTGLAIAQDKTPLGADGRPSGSAAREGVWQSAAATGPGGAPNWAREMQERLASQKITIERVLAERESALAEASRAEVARAAAETERTAAVAARDQALAKFNADTEANRQAVAQLTEKTRESIDEVDKIVASTGLDPNHLAPLRMQDRHNEPGQPRGGPFVPWTNPPPGRAALPPGPADGSPDVDRLRALTAILAQLPLSAPVTRLVVSSPFGYRTDPFTGAAALHEGIDLEGGRDTPVLATAPGVVAFVGTRTDYGSVVEINHGSGLMTRYAHLDRPLVKVGDHVTLHQQIGLMGATGRVTGVHLHYEVRVDGVAQDPANFIEVKSHVPQQR